MRETRFEGPSWDASLLASRSCMRLILRLVGRALSGCCSSGAGGGGVAAPAPMLSTAGMPRLSPQAAWRANLM